MFKAVGPGSVTVLGKPGLLATDPFAWARSPFEDALLASLPEEEAGRVKWSVE